MSKTLAPAAAAPEISPGAAEAPRSRPIALYLVVLALVALIPMLGFSVVLLQRNNQAQEDVVQSLAVATTQALQQSVDREVEGMITILKVLSTDASLGSNDLSSFYARAQAALQDTGAFVILTGSNYQQLLNTRTPFGSQLGETADPRSVDHALAGNASVVSNVFFGKTANDWVFNVSTAVPGSSHRVLIMTQNARNLARALQSHQMPDNWHVALVDDDNSVIAASDPHAEIGKPFFLPRPSGRAMPTRWTRLPVNGEDILNISWTSEATDWRVVAWASAATVERPLYNSLWFLVLGGLVILAFAGAVTFFLASEIRKSVRGLAIDARRMGAGESVQARDYPITEIATVSRAIHDAGEKRRKAEAEARFLMRELAHRSKNQMTVIAAMAKQTARGADSVPEFVQSFEKRIFGLARSTDLLLANGTAGVDLRELLTHQVNPFCPMDGQRVNMSGPPLRLNTQSAQILGMAAHELATNAAKYGAFASDDGQLAINWSMRGDRLDFLWRETVRTPTKVSERRGFGTTVVENMVGAALGAEISRTLHSDGIEWRFDIPLEALNPLLSPDKVGTGAALADETDAAV